MASFGPYALLRRLGVGGMGEVFLAVLEREAGFRKLLVIKRILPQLSSREDFRDLFKREARLAALLSHQNIVQIFDYGQIDNQAFIAMEFVDGLDCSTLLRENHGPLPPRIVLRILMDAARGLDHAHRKKGPDNQGLGLVHRDVNPRNLLVSFEGEVKWIDFGLAGALSREGDDRLLAGTVPYMSPEQAAGESVDARSDLFSLAVAAYELFCGRRPYPSADSVDQQVSLTRAADFDLPSEVAGLPPEVDLVLLRALAPHPEGRYSSARELLTALERLSGPLGGVAPPRELGALAEALAPPEMRGRAQIVERTQVGDQPLVQGGGDDVPRTVPAETPLNDKGEPSIVVEPEMELDVKTTQPPLKRAIEDAPITVVPAVAAEPVPTSEPEPLVVKGRGALWALVAVLLVVAGVSTWLLVQGRGENTTTGAETPPSASGVWRLEVTSQPGNAEVFLDGVRKGTTPFVLENVAVGAYSLLSVKAEGHQPHEERLTLGSAGGALKLQAILEPFDALLTLAVEPKDARVSINGVNVALPVVERTVESGKVVVVAQHPNYQTKTVNVDIESGKSKREEIVLEPLPAKLKVETDPSSASVTLELPGEGSRSCRAPCVFGDLAPGTYIVRAEAQGRLPAQEEITLMANQAGEPLKLVCKEPTERKQGPSARVRAVGGVLFEKNKQKKSARVESGTLVLRSPDVKVTFFLKPTPDLESMSISLQTEPFSPVRINGKHVEKPTFYRLKAGNNTIRILPLSSAPEGPVELSIKVRKN